MKKLYLLVMLLLIFSISGCNLFSKDKDSVNVVKDNNSAYVIINGETLYDKDFYNFAGVVLKELSEDDYNNKEIKQYLVDSFIEHNLLLQEAKKRNITVDSKQINSVTDSFLTESGTQDLKVYSGSFNTDANELAKILKEKYMIENLIYNIVNTEIDIPESAIKKEYNDNYANKVSSKRAHIYQIFTTDKQVAEKAMAELKRGLSFNEVAGRYSEGPEKDEGGDLGFIEDTVYPEIFSEAFKLRAGRYGEIIKSEYGYHIFLVKEYGMPRKVDYASVKNDIHFTLYNKEQNKKIEELINELYKNADIEFITDINLSRFTGKSGSSR